MRHNRRMRFLMFDVKPAPGRMQQYLDTAAALRPELDKLGGCLLLDRFKDLDDAQWILSFQFWRDEAAITAWRNHRVHHAAQEAGRREVFADYRIRIGEVLESPEADAPREGRYVVIARAREPNLRAEPGLKRFASIYRPGEYLHALAATNLAHARETAQALRILPAAIEVRIGQVERDYSLRERAEAPQVWAAA